MRVNGQKPTLRERSERAAELIKRYRRLGLPALQLHRLTIEADPRGKGVSYLTIRRVVEGTIPTMRTLDKIEAALTLEERKRDRSAARKRAAVT
jgi:hypothetical protein